MSSRDVECCFSTQLNCGTFSLDCPSSTKQLSNWLKKNRVKFSSQSEHTAVFPANQKQALKSNFPALEAGGISLFLNLIG